MDIKSASVRDLGLGIESSFTITVVCSVWIDENIQAASIPISYYHSENLDILCDSILWADWVMSYNPNLWVPNPPDDPRQCVRDSVRRAGYTPKVFRAGVVWFLPPGLPPSEEKRELCTAYFNGTHTQIPNWDTTKSIVLDSITALPGGQMLELVDTTGQTYQPIFSCGLIGDAVLISGTAYRTDGITPDTGISIYCRGKDVYRDTFYFPGRVLEDITDENGYFSFTVGKGGFWCVFADTTGGLADNNAYCFYTLMKDTSGIYFVEYQTAWVRAGDPNADGVINLSDVIYIALYKISGGDPPDPWESGDVNCDCVIDLSDARYLANYYLKSGPPPCCYFP